MKRDKRLDALKGIACFMVMTTHFWGIYNYAENMGIFPAPIDWIARGKIPFFGILNASFWLMVFLIISGYLLSQKKINSFQGVIENSAFRFIRLFIPVLCCGLIIAVISDVIFMMHQDLRNYFSCEWLFQSVNTNLSVFDVLRAAIDTVLFGENELQSAFWMIAPLLYTSIAVYFYNWIVGRISRPAARIGIFCVFTIVCTLAFDFCGFSVFLGVLLQRLLETRREKKVHRKILLIFVIFVTTGLNDAVYYNLMKFISNETIMHWYIALFSFTVSTKLWGLGVCAAIYLILSSSGAEKILLNKATAFLYSINWEIYCVHMLVINTVGIYMLIALNGKFSLLGTMFVTYVVSVLMTLIISLIYKNTISILTEKILVFFYRRLK